jgi:hypothetical protein
VWLCARVRPFTYLVGLDVLVLQYANTGVAIACKHVGFLDCTYIWGRQTSHVALHLCTLAQWELVESTFGLYPVVFVASNWASNRGVTLVAVVPSADNTVFAFAADYYLGMVLREPFEHGRGHA